MNMWRFLTLTLMASVAEVLGTAGQYCSVNTFTSNTAGMQFTKEPVPTEFGFEDKFKSIHCCVKGYRSIEWFKNGVPYPWSAGVSNLILYPEAANQTLYTGSATRSDSGNYTCRISNETHSDVHTITLDILDKPIDRPRRMFISKDQWVDEGDELRLFCEALVGKSYLADALSDLRWRKIWPNGTEGDLLPTQNETRTHRDDVTDIRGSFMHVARVTPLDFGAYACVVHSNGAVVTSNVTVHRRGEEEPGVQVQATPGSESSSPVGGRRRRRRRRRGAVARAGAVRGVRRAGAAVGGGAAPPLHAAPAARAAAAARAHRRARAPRQSAREGFRRGGVLDACGRGGGARRAAAHAHSQVQVPRPRVAIVYHARQLVQRDVAGAGAVPVAACGSVPVAVYRAAIAGSAETAACATALARRRTTAGPAEAEARGEGERRAAGGGGARAAAAGLAPRARPRLLAGATPAAAAPALALPTR
ncbi:uncharacterized protein LOC113522466 isoform X1 [Galleria mellonella]|uniref:Soluble interferon alpha/beta receptor OPG204 n=1 Tax=Galleria mellonella TaxID=7137 RepID=A0ABM3MR49_GALME|nr:uncharacterized protein LOC113522466 isoform X1 [Galleria mellonella]